MRDGLSLLDQAVAQGNGRVTTTTVRQMLGLIDTDYVRELLEALGRGDTRAVFDTVDSISRRSSAYAQILDDMLTQLFYLSLYKRDPALLEAKQESAPWHEGTAELLDEEDLQLFYQIALIGKRDLPLSPDPRTGFEMILLRLLAFRPGAATGRPAGNAGRGEAAASSARAKAVADERPAESTGAASAAEADWRRLARRLPLTGWAQELAMNLAMLSRDERAWSFELNPQYEHLVNDERTGAVARALSEELGKPVEVKIRLSEPAVETPVQSVEREKSDKQKQAEQAIKNDPDVQDLIDQFDATLVEDSIRSRQ
jgi:DNA polymerase-3 subunit gamma/tau